MDVEYLRDLKDAGRLAERFFSAEEREYLESRPPGETKEAFFSCWTRKEAYVKGLGVGISYPLSAFSTIGGDGGEAEIVRDANLSAAGPVWSLFSLPAGTGYAGAVAVEGFEGAPELFEYGAGAAGTGGHP